MKHRLGSFSNFTPRPKEKPVIVDAVDFYQSSCWHCKAVWVGLDVKQTDRGKVCPVCSQLNEDPIQSAP